MTRLASILAASESLAGSRGGPPYLLLLTGIAIVVLAIVGLYFWNHKRQVQAASGDSAEDLFSELCEFHKLSRAERSMLASVVRTFELPQPASLFVDPWPLDQASAASDPDAPRYAVLRAKLFASEV